MDWLYELQYIRDTGKYPVVGTAEVAPSKLGEYPSPQPQCKEAVICLL